VVQLVAVARLKKLVLGLQVLLVRVLHYSLVQTAVQVLEQRQVHCLLSDVVLHWAQVQVQVQKDHSLLA
jgi:hypothetical protein